MSSVIDIFKGATIKYQPVDLDWDALANPMEVNSIIGLMANLDNCDKGYFTLAFSKKLYFIREIYWEIEHITTTRKSRQHNKHLSWIATGTYYHYSSSDDEDSKHSANAMTNNGLIIDAFIHRT